MAKGLRQFEELTEDGVRYAKLKWVSVRLALVENLSTLVNKAYGYLIVLILALIAVVFLMVALSLWLGELLGHMSLGFLISGGAFLIAAAVVFFLRRKLIINSLVGTFANLFFTTKDDDDEQEEYE